ncbi:MAG TPA: penicillin-binding protein activator [Bacteroidota bacterium]|nr:penicillin-binding protein activator [Bacteroidota bacterium]
MGGRAISAAFVASLVLSMHPVMRAGTIALQDSIAFSPDAERQFVEGMKFFQAGHYDSAAVYFRRHLKEFPQSHRATGAYIMGGKSLYFTADYRESVKLLKDFIDRYSESLYIPDAHYTLGLDYYKEGRYEDAASEFLTVRQTARESKLLARSDRLLNLICSNNLSLAEVQLLVADATIPETRALLNVRLAEKIYQAGDVKGAVAVLKDVAALPPNIPAVGDALNLLDRIQKGGTLKVGVVLPLLLKGEDPQSREVGLDFLSGIQLATDDYNRGAATKVTLDVRDSERDPSVAARQVTELCGDEKVSAILGPLSSNEVFAGVGISNAKGVPLITPTATANGIAAVGGFVFQANPDYDVRGRAMAQYAFDKLGERRFGVLAPVDAPGKQMADAFTDQVKKCGGEVIDVQWYQSGTTDLRIQLSTMRQRALEKTEVPFVDFSAKLKKEDIDKMLMWGVNSRVVDSLSEREDSALVTFLFGPQGAHIADSLQIPTGIVKLKYDSLGLPVQNVDGLFVPIANSDEIPVVTSQIKFYNFQSQLLGTGDWNDIMQLDQNQEYTDGVIFTVDSYTDAKDPAYRQFALKYRQSNKDKPPGMNALYGYDSMKMLLSVISGGAIHRNEIAGALQNVKGFSGLHSKISFMPTRVNGYLTVMQYRGHTVRKVGEEDLTQDSVVTTQGR